MLIFQKRGRKASLRQPQLLKLNQGQSKAEALRSAKLEFLRSGTTLSAPRHWAAYVLNGDGWNPSPHAVPWSFLLLAIAVILAIGGLVIHTYFSETGAKGVTEAAASSPRNPNIVTGEDDCTTK